MADRFVNTSGKDDWATPPWVVRYACTVLGIEAFDLDAAAKADTAKAVAYLGPDHKDPSRRDALALPWPGQTVWLNSPYSKKGGGLDKWLSKCVEARDNGATVCALFFSRTETAAWHDYVTQAAEVHLIRGRLSFIDPATGQPAKGKKGRPQSAPAPSCLAIWQPGCNGPPRFIHVPKAARAATTTGPVERPAATQEIPMTPYIATVTTNLKGTDKNPRTFNLGPKTLIIGPNGSGKSTIPQAIELALTGRVSDVAGKDPKTPTALATLAPPGADQLTVELACADTGSVMGSSWSMRVNPPGKGKAFDTSAAYMPLRDLRTALSSSDKAQRFLFGAVGGAVTWDDVLSRIPAGRDRTLFSSVVHEDAGRIDPAGALLRARDAVHRAFLDERATVKGATTTIETMGQGLAPMPTELAMTAARQAVADAGTAQQQAMHEAARTEGHAHVVARLIELNTDQQNTSHQIQAIMDDYAVPETPEQIMDARSSNARIAAARLLIERLITTGSDVCGLCNQPVPGGSGALWWHTRHQIIEHAAHGKAMVLRYLDLCDHLAIVESAISAFMVEHPGAANPGPYPPSKTGEKVVVLHEAQAALDALTRLQGQWNSVNTARASKAEAERKRDEWKRLEGHVEVAVAELLETARTAFVGRVQAYLPKTDTFGLELAPFRFGLVREDVLHTALSGAEWARVTMALAAVTSEGRPGFPVIVPEDRAWDAATLSAAMRAVSNLPGQVIICTTTKPKGRMPKGWTVLDLPARSNESVAAPEPEVKPEVKPEAEPEAEPEPELVPDAADLAQAVVAVLRELHQRPGIDGALVPDLMPQRTGGDVMRVLGAHLTADTIGGTTASWVHLNVGWGRTLIASWLEQHPPLTAI